MVPTVSYPKPLDLRRLRGVRRGVAKVMMCQRCRCPLVETESGWLACYWLCDRLKDKEIIVRKLIEAGFAESGDEADYEIKRFLKENSR